MNILYFKRIAIFFVFNCYGLFNTAQAHVVLETPTTNVGSYYKAVFKVSHSCPNSPTLQVIIEVPEGFRGAKPMVKMGWEIRIQKENLANPYTSNGKKNSRDTSKIEWSGKLSPEFYDEFVIVGQAPMVAANLYWKVTQICESGKLEWNEIPVEGKFLKDYKNPAALLKVIADSADHSQHQH